MRDDWRGRGVGSVTLRWLVEWARSNPVIHRLELEVFTHNAGAIKLYERLGFVNEGTLREDFFKDGRYADSHIMAILFDREGH